MDTDDKLDELIGVLYETAMDASRWQDALALCAEYVGGLSAHVMTFDKADNRVVLSLHGGAPITDENAGVYSAYYIGIDPRETRGMMKDAATHEWRFCHNYLDRSFVARNEFYQDYYIPGGFRYSMGAWVDDVPEQRTLLGLHRPPDHVPFGHAERAAAERISPHLQRALRLGSHTRNLQAKAELGVRAIDALQWPMLIVDGQTRILHLNAAAERLLEADGGPLICRSSHLTSAEPGTESMLAALIVAATDNPAVGGAMALTGLQARQVWVTPLPAASAMVRDWQQPLALVMVQAGNGAAPNLSVGVGDLPPAALREASAFFRLKSPEQAAQETSNHFALTYRLTGREAKVLRGLMDGYSVKEIAERHGVSRNTVRSQLASLMHKTDCRRQKDLIRLFLRGNPYA